MWHELWILFSILNWSCLLPPQSDPPILPIYLSVRELSATVHTSAASQNNGLLSFHSKPGTCSLHHITADHHNVSALTAPNRPPSLFLQIHNSTRGESSLTCKYGHSRKARRHIYVFTFTSTPHVFTIICNTKYNIPDPYYDVKTRKDASNDSVSTRLISARVWMDRS